MHSNVYLTVTENNLSVEQSGEPPRIDMVIASTVGVSGVTSVNGDTGVVTLNADNLPETATKVFLTPAQKTQITTNQTNIGTNVTAISLNTAKVGVTTEEANPDLISQAEAEAGTATTERIFSALRVKQAITQLAPTTSPSGAQYEIQYSDGAGNFDSSTNLKTDASGNLYALNIYASDSTTTGQLFLGSDGQTSFDRDWAEQVKFKINGDYQIWFVNAHMRVGSTYQFRWGNSVNPTSGATDFGLKRVSPNLGQVTDGSTGFGGLSMDSTSVLVDSTDNSKTVTRDLSTLASGQAVVITEPAFNFDFNSFIDSVYNITTPKIIFSGDTSTTKAYIQALASTIFEIVSGNNGTRQMRFIASEFSFLTGGGTFVQIDSTGNRCDIELTNHNFNIESDVKDSHTLNTAALSVNAKQAITTKYLQDWKYQGATKAYIDADGILNAPNIQTATHTESGNYTIVAATDGYIEFTGTAAADFTIYTATGNDGSMIEIKNMGTAQVTLLTLLSQLIDNFGSGTVKINPLDWIRIRSNGTHWRIIG